MRILGAGGMPPKELRSFCADLKDDYRQQWLPERVRSAPRRHLSKAFDKLVNFALAKTAASLERLALYIPAKVAPLPEMSHLQHLTLQLSSTFDGLKLMAMPEMRSIVFVHASTAKDDYIGPMHLTGLERLQSLYLGNVVPKELSLPPGCALHLHCSSAEVSRLSPEPGWEKALEHHQSLCEQLPGAALPYQATIILPPLSYASLTAISVTSSTLVDVGTLGNPISFWRVPALQRVVLDIAGTMHIEIPEGHRITRFWARRLTYLHMTFESARNFVQHIDAMRLDVEMYNSEDWAEVTAALEERGTPLVVRQPHPAGTPTHVIKGCMYDVEAEGQPACVCQICLDCLVRRTCRPSELPAALEQPLF